VPFPSLSSVGEDAQQGAAQPMMIGSRAVSGRKALSAGFLRGGGAPGVKQLSYLIQT